MTPDPVRVLVADDQAMLRGSFRLLIEHTPGMTTVGEASDGAEAVALARRELPDVVLMDIRMPGVDGIEATREICSSAELAGVRVLILTTFDLDEYVYAALRAGAAGFLLKDTPPADIVRAVRLVAAGEAMLSPGVTRRLLTHVTDPALGSRQARAKELLERLSERERAVALAIGQGKSNAEISGELYMSVATVKAHVSRLLTKLELTNRVQVALLAHDAGLV
jgi:DNA-binding NarL/FixJ family response regulator